MAHGFGIFNHTDGSSYEGQWINDKNEGEGKEIWPDGTKFEGSYKEGVKHGFGIFVWSNNCSYKGNFYNNAMDGIGCYRWADGREYNGSWK